MEDLESVEHVLEANLEDSGGAFSLVFQVQKQLTSRVIFDYFSMSSFANGEIVKEIEDMGGHVYEASLRRNRLLGHVLLPFVFFRFLKKQHYRVVHIHSDTAWKICLYAISAKLARIERIIIHSHSGGINGDHRMLKSIAHNMMKPLMPYVGTVHCTCSKIAASWMYGDRPRYPVIWVKNGVDIDKFAFSADVRSIVRSELQIDDGTIAIGTVGDFSYPKNPEYLIRVMYELKKLRSNKYKLIFVGSGESEDAVSFYASERNLDDDIIFYGKTGKVQDVLCALDIYAMPSRFEGLPVSAIEAQASGLPCILSSNITTEVNLGQNVHFLELAEDVSNWVEMIEVLSQVSHSREKGKDVVCRQGFDIRQTADMIYRLYYTTLRETG